MYVAVRVEVEYYSTYEFYSIAFFDHITAFEAL